MDISTLLIGLAPGALLFLAGYLIRYRRMYFLISGYNTMSAEKKKQVDTEGLGRFMGGCLFLMGGLMMAGMSLVAFRMETAGLYVMLIILPVVIYLLIGAQKFDGTTRDESGRMKTSSKILLGGIIFFLIVLTGGIVYSMQTNSKPVVLVLSQQSVEITGMYGVTLERASIRDISLQETLPAILKRTNGSAVENHLKGNFTMETVGKVKLFIDRSIPPFIMIRTEDQTIFVNQGTAADTKALYDAMLSP